MKRPHFASSIDAGSTFGNLTRAPLGGSPDLGLGSSVFERNGVKVANANCMMCHAGNIQGNVVAGLANNALDFNTLVLPRERVTTPAALAVATFHLKGAAAIRIRYSCETEREQNDGISAGAKVL